MFEKRLQKLRNAPHSASSEDVLWVLEHAGFRLRQGKGHIVCTHPAFKEPLPIPHPKNPIKCCYVYEALDRIDTLRMALGGERDERQG